jgi:TetR/AcrR family transcriptional repressor of nem operon
MLAAAKAKHAPGADFDPEAVAWCLNSLWQGSMLVGKVENRPAMIRSNLRLALAWVESLLTCPDTHTKTNP